MKRSGKGPWWLHVLALVIGLVALRLGWLELQGGADSPPPGSASTAPSGSAPTAPSGSAPTAPSGSAPTAGPPDRGVEEPPSRAPSGERGEPAPAGAELVGFTSKRAWREHFAKHGAEFGKITAEEYLRLAQGLRDAPRSQLVLERVRDDGVITRYDRASGAFLAFHRDLSIRTFFRPKDGEAYFERQALR